MHLEEWVPAEAEDSLSADFLSNSCNFLWLFLFRLFLLAASCRKEKGKNFGHPDIFFLKKTNTYTLFFKSAAHAVDLCPELDNLSRKEHRFESN